MNRIVSASLLGLSLALVMFSGKLQIAASPQETADGKAVFSANCASCHTDANSKTPSKEQLSHFAPNFIVSALTDGAMSIQGKGLSREARIAVAEFLTDQKFVERPVTITQGLCTDRTPMTAPASMPQWNGWGPDARNQRFQTKEAAGMSATDVPKLKLKWAFGLPGESQARSQPAIVGGRLFTGLQAGGAIYSLNARTGCTYWTFLPQAGVRSALSVGPKADGKGFAVYFVDIQATVYAVDADTGRQLWSRKVEDHPAVRATGALTIYQDRIYVPMSAVSEESAASNARYECCKFRGSITALDTATGNVVWKTYTTDEPKERGTSSAGVKLWGPAGVGIWSAPTIDAKRGRIYAATGNAYADPLPKTADAVIALDLKTGKLVWSTQLLRDAWLMGCQSGSNNTNCPQEVGPDFDFSASPILATAAGGRDIIVVPQKSGMLYALDPAKDGQKLWEYRAGPGSAVGGVWGSAVGDGLAYVAVGGYFGQETGGIHGVNLETGERVWYTPPQTPALCAANTAAPGALGTAPGGRGGPAGIGAPGQRGPAVPAGPAVAGGFGPPAGAGGPAGQAGPGGPRGFGGQAGPVGPGGPAGPGGFGGPGGPGGRGGFGGGGSCGSTQSAAVTAIPGGVFSGSADGGMRFYAAKDGAVTWTFNANRAFETTNGIDARGGSFDGPGPVAVDGMVYMLSGNGGVASAGNVLLAFEIEK